ncbi:MAG: HNH endonuclease [Planctomycetes bacterium]|nr:HNH endonuclease [Planctomycetota bacterium]
MTSTGQELTHDPILDAAPAPRRLRCGACRRRLPPEAFYRDASRGTRLASRCRACTASLLREWDGRNRTRRARAHDAAKRARFARDPIANAKNEARIAYRRAWRSGALPRKQRRCAGCLGRFPRREIEGHHPDALAAPLVTVPVCGPCHRLYHGTETTSASTYTSGTFGPEGSSTAPGGA